MDNSIKETWIKMIHQLQDEICSSLEAADGKARFREDAWQRPAGGGGNTRIIAQGEVFEKGGVNSSVVFGELTEPMRRQLNMDGAHWFACGISLVLHPFHPMVPTVHANYRMFELYDDTYQLLDRWFGGGTDLTPFYLFEEDARHFHKTYQAVCDRFDPIFYSKFKASCDDYFVNRHRNEERRGIGGIFYDYERSDEHKDAWFWVNFAKACGQAFIPSYLPLVEKRKLEPAGEEQRYWQEIRRGRYAEFNLLHDRGTIFGLKTNGRTESILMSLPPRVRWDYNYSPQPGSAEHYMLQACLHPREWTNPG